jgi:hypothetical protein
MPNSLVLNQKPIQPRIDEPRYGHKVCPECKGSLSFETKTKIHLVCKRKRDARLAAERKTHGTH